jgi:hypothetical protein
MDRARHDAVRRGDRTETMGGTPVRLEARMHHGRIECRRGPHEIEHVSAGIAAGVGQENWMQALIERLPQEFLVEADRIAPEERPGTPRRKRVRDFADHGIVRLSRRAVHVVECGLDVINIGSAGWRALLSRDGPVGSGSTANPFGAGAASCFGAANVFRRIFADQLPRGDLDDRIDLSLSTYFQGSAAVSELPERCDLGDAYLVGLGAIGNGAVWALSRIPGLAGVLHLVDHENADLSNLQRYVMAMQDDVGRRKVRLARAFFTQGTLKVRAHPQRWSDYVVGRRKRAFERVAVALDTAQDRIALQASLPKWIVNAWTQDVDLGISRHAFTADGACLACLYLPTGAVKNEDERVAEELRIGGMRPRWSPAPRPGRGSLSRPQVGDGILGSNLPCDVGACQRRANRLAEPF